MDVPSRDVIFYFYGGDFGYGSHVNYVSEGYGLVSIVAKVGWRYKNITLKVDLHAP